jgi:enoyl-CoA hydratase/carnithine racemase
MLFLGKRVTAEEAQVANLISEVIPKDRLMEEVRVCV